MRPRDTWLMPVVLNLMAMTGLVWALLSEGLLSKTLATLLLAIPIATALYQATKSSHL